MTIYSRLKTSLFQVWEHLPHSSRRSRAGVDDEQITRRSWAKKVSDLEALPQAFQLPVLEIIREEQALPYAVLTPTFEGYLKRENEKLVFCLDNRLFVLEKDGQNVSVTHYELKNIYRIEFGEILLKAWIIICGIDDRGVYSNTTLRFNSVTDFLFDPFIEAVRRSDELANPRDIQQEREKFSPLKARHIKFMNYARKSLLPGERVAQYILQPELETTGMKLFGVTLFRRTLCMTHILIQTDRELILIHDEQTCQRLRDDSRYGGIWNYMPINQLQDLIIEEDSGGMVNLTIRLPAGEFLHMPYAIERRPELEQFVENVKEAIKYPVPSIS